MPFILGANSLTGGYAVDNSLRFNAGSGDYLNRTPASAGNRQIWTWSGWVKRPNSTNYPALFTAGNDGTEFYFLQDTNQLLFYYYNGGYIGQVRTAGYFRDVSAWYHVVLAVDTTQATDTNRIKIYVNGTLQTLTSTTYPPQNTSMDINNTTTHYIGRYGTGASGVRNGDYYLAETYLIDGQALDPTSFGEFDEDTGIWIPKKYTGTYGTNGFYLDFENSGSLGADQSGNANNFTVNNLTSIDQVTDTPTNNFATMNPLDQNGGVSFSEGNLAVASTSASWRSTRGTFGITQGKWYFEVKVTNVGGSLLDMMVGIADFSLAIPSEFSSSNPALTYTAGSGNKQLNGVNSAYGATYNINDIIGVAFDADNLTVTFYKNGTSQGTITTGWSSGLTWSPAISLYGRYGNTQASFNFGNPPFTISSGNSDANGYGNFEYAVPSGYYSLCTKNLAEFG